MALLHTLCASILLLVATSRVANACHGQLLASGITEEDKRVILYEHNKLRQLIATGRYPGQPAAENMREIVWDNELAARAQQWADNCQFRHDPQRTINRFTMGQNLAVIWSTAPLDADDGDFPSRIQAWFNEVQKYSFGDAWSPKTGHYSQLVWGETSLVGCGFSEYKDTTKYNKLYVCNYGPGGNVVGFKPYEVGKPSCATYGMRPSAHYQGLCAAPTAPSAGIFSNTIETYDSNNYNQQQATANQLQPASSPSFDSPPKQATYLRKTSTSRSTFKATVPESILSAAKAVPTAAAAAVSSGQYTKYRNKLESYRPSEAEFQKSVRKHTVLRTFINQEQSGGVGDQSQSDVADGGYEAVEESTTAKPAKRGWSLLTWRG